MFIRLTNYFWIFTFASSFNVSKTSHYQIIVHIKTGQNFNVIFILQTGFQITYLCSILFNLHIHIYDDD